MAANFGVKMSEIGRLTFIRRPSFVQPLLDTKRYPEHVHL